MAPSTLYMTPWRAPHLHGTLHTCNHRKVELRVPPQPPKTRGPRKRGHTWEAPAQLLPRPIKAKIKGLQEQLRVFSVPEPTGARAGGS